MNALYRTRGQWAVLAVFLAAGVLAGLLADALFALARRMGGGRLLEAAAAFLAGAGAALIAAAACLQSAAGQARLYMAAAVAAGALLYRATLGALLRRLGGGLARFMRRCGQAIRKNPAIARLLR